MHLCRRACVCASICCVLPLRRRLTFTASIFSKCWDRVSIAVHLAGLIYGPVAGGSFEVLTDVRVCCVLCRTVMLIVPVHIDTQLTRPA